VWFLTVNVSDIAGAAHARHALQTQVMYSAGSSIHNSQHLHVCEDQVRVNDYEFVCAPVAVDQVLL
jgi:hypothetical protein